MKVNRQLGYVKSLSLACACLLSGTALGAEKFTVSEEQMQALGIKLIPVQNAMGEVRSRYPAQVVVPPKSEQVISSPLEGLVTQLLVGEFQAVKRGEALARLSSPAMSQLQLQLLQASARATLARQASAREQSLFEEGIIPQRRAQESLAALKEAEATLAQAKSELALAGLSKESMEQVIRTGIPSDSITLTATQDGIVSSISVRPGQRVDAATALLNVTQVDTLWLDVQIPASSSLSVKAGARVEVADKQVSGRVPSLSPTITANNQFVVLRAEIDGASAGLLRPGELVTVEIPVESSGQAWSLPLTAVARNKDDSVIFVRTTDGFLAKPVKVQASAGQLVRVEGDLGPQDQVAVSGVVALKGAWLEEDGE
ncbi:TPA: efflux RND transporter periplasmic adaptor subunit [Pseudomonas aeruginosa]